jgi:hypothetical protein
MPILTLQKRARELGRIRIGQKGDKGQPQKLDRFRVTSPAKHIIEKIAELYGGEAREWTPAGGAQQWEVITDARRMPIMVPPQPVSQFLETWSAGGCTHRCDGETNFLTGDPCDPDDPAHLAAKPTTRLNVVLRDVEGIGVFRLESHGWNAAVELPQAAEFLASAGGYVEGWVSLEERVSKSEGETRRFMVPIIEIDVTPAELMAGKGRVATPELEGPVPKAPALESGQQSEDPFTPFFDRLAAATTVEQCQVMWSEMVAAQLVGTHAEATPRAREFLEAFKAKGKELTQGPAASGQPDTEGIVDAELVDDVDEDAIWQQIVVAAGRRNMTKPDLEEDFLKQMGGLSAGDASAAELKHYLSLLTKDPAA